MAAAPAAALLFTSPRLFSSPSFHLSLPRSPPLGLAACPWTPNHLALPVSPSYTGSCRSSRPGVRRNAEPAYVPGSGKYLAPDYIVKKVTAKEVEELVFNGERKVPLIVDFYATWCGPCVTMAQEIEMLAVEYENTALFVKVDTDDEYEFARDMQVRGLPTLYFFSPDQSKDAIRTEGLIPNDMIKRIIDNEL